jgi:hypothetical protein
MELPALPEMVDTYETSHYPKGFTADQMREYGEQCALAERARCIQVCESEVDYGLADLIAAIRKG